MFSKISEKKFSENWGGKREGSGRKTKYEKTKVMRIPEKYSEVIKALIEHLDQTAELDQNYKPVESDPVFIRSLKDKKQDITFKTSPKS
ncbi:hypothetical protein D5018_21180 [Parashewanella curva]|uniref:Uncharacterized protein n=2 Tax=Parashewanella curva TaxID=2338552 RepID=A0A3L8PTG4_9GAMM|nr:hypothetical protein D5018_21180 [Parashewanella curva]